MRQSTLFPVLLVIGGVFGALWCFDGFLVRGDLTWQQTVVGFAFACLVAALGAQELMTTQLHESDERGGL